MRIGVHGREPHVWDFPGSEKELWGEWQDRFAPLHLDPDATRPPQDFMGRLRRVVALPDDLDGHLEFGRRPRLRVGAMAAYAGQAPRRGLPDHPIYGPLADVLPHCPHEVQDDRLVSLHLPTGVSRKVVKATLRHRCIRGLRELQLGRIEKLDGDRALACLSEGGPLPDLVRLRWAGDLDAPRWATLKQLAPALEELALTRGGRLVCPPPGLRRVHAARVDPGPTHEGPAELAVWGFDASNPPGWWPFVQTLRLERVPARRHTLAALCRLPAPAALRGLVLSEGADLDMVAPAVVALFDAWPELQLLTLGKRPVARPQLEALRAKADRLPAWEPAAVAEALATLGYTLRDPVPEARLVALEEELELQLPASYRDFLLRFGDGGAGPGFGVVSVLDDELRVGRPGLPFDPTRGHTRLDGTLLLCDHGFDRRTVLVVSGPDAGTVWIDDPDAGLQPVQVPDGCELDFRGWYVDWLELALRPDA